MEKSRDRVVRRSASQCEALVWVDHLDHRGQQVWTRCFKTPIEVHHRLTRARGGALLDALGETYHLIALCPTHHRDADGALAYAGGLLLDGLMTSEGYQGSDPYLSRTYGPARQKHRGEAGEHVQGSAEGPQ